MRYSIVYTEQWTFRLGRILEPNRECLRQGFAWKFYQQTSRKIWRSVYHGPSVYICKM